MSNSLSIIRFEIKPIVFMIISAIITTLFLFYIDEGFYSFAWMKQGGAWIVFALFTAAFTSFQFILAYPFQKLLVKKKAFVASMIIAFLPLALIMAILLVLLN